MNVEAEGPLSDNDNSYGIEMSKNRLAQLQRPKKSFLGKLLVAAPGMPVGSPFNRAVILVLQDSEEGVFGVVLNRPASPEMLMAWQKVAGKPTFAAEKLVAGGPVQGPVLAIHRQQELAELEIHGGLFVSVQQEAIEQLSQMEFFEEDVAFRIVLGAVSWDAGQLENEIDNGVWFVVDSEPDSAFSDMETLWQRSVRRYGEESVRELAGIRNFPPNPLLN